MACGYRKLLPRRFQKHMHVNMGVCMWKYTCIVVQLYLLYPFI